MSNLATKLTIKNRKKINVYNKNAKKIEEFLVNIIILKVLFVEFFTVLKLEILLKF